MQYLKIENQGVCAPEFWTLLGASTKRGAGERVIGTFGSGNKHGVLVLMRHHLQPVIYCGNLCLSFFSQRKTITDSLGDHDVGQVGVKYSGTDEEGRSRTSRDDLSYCIDYGSSDWLHPALALREFVSNALDRSIMEFGDFSHVSVEIVDEKSVRAKTGTTRVFVPLSEDVEEFHQQLGKWFLHFSEPHLLSQTILPKRNRNLRAENERAVIYRRGVRIREFTASNLPSLFDYNFQDIRLNEVRTLGDWDVRHAVGQALSAASRRHLTTVLQAMIEGKEAWELTMDSYSLRADNEKEIPTRQEVWKAALETIAGENAIFVPATGNVAAVAERKGYKPVLVKTEHSAWLETARKFGVPNDESVLTEDDKAGREYYPATQDVVNSLNGWWGIIERADMTNGKEKPPVFMFNEIMRAGSQCWGMYKDGRVLIHRDIDGGLLSKCMVEELAHHITGSTDMSRDFQDWAFRFLAWMAEHTVEKSWIKAMAEHVDKK